MILELNPDHCILTTWAWVGSVFSVRLCVLIFKKNHNSGECICIVFVDVCVQEYVCVC